MEISAGSIILGLAVTIGGGLVLATISVLVLWLQRLLRQRNADREYLRYLAQTRQQSCSVCGDMLATMECSSCGIMLCRSCADQSPRCRGRSAEHTFVSVEQQSGQQEDHYRSFRF